MYDFGLLVGLAAGCESSLVCSVFPYAASLGLLALWSWWHGHKRSEATC